MYKIVQLSLQLKEDFDELLSKALKPSDWNKIAKVHNEEAAALVDHTPYLVEHAESHPHYKAMLDEPKEYSSKLGPDVAGVAKKLVHRNVREDVPHVSAGFGTYMVKPFHHLVESGTRHHGTNPHFGWSTMAANGLFHAAGMGDNVEDVSVHEHQGVPITVHRFAPGHETWGKALRDSYIPANAQAMRHPDTTLAMGKGAILDFLMGNTDRHANNIMYKPESHGGHKPLFIDNERTFQYKNPMLFTNEYLRRGNQNVGTDYIAAHAGRNLPENAVPHIQEYDVRDWWDEHKNAMKDEFYRHLKNIKDPHVRGHIERNFNQRMEHVEDHLGAGVFSHDYPGVQIIRAPKRQSVTTKQILAQLPQDPAVAIDTLEASMKGKSAAVRKKLSDAANALIPQLSPDQMVQVYHKHKNHSQLHGIGYDILKHVHESDNKEAKKKFLDMHSNSMRSLGMDPDGAVYQYGVGLPPFWHERFLGKERE